jgi:hypothetical protein
MGMKFPINLQDVHTPFGLCFEMVGKLGEYTSLIDKDYLVFNLEFVDVLMYNYFVEGNRIWFVTDCVEKVKICGHKRYSGVNVVMKDFADFLKEDGNGTTPMPRKFDVVIMNPPWNKKLHLSFLKKIVDLGEKIVSVQPVGWLMCERKPSSAIEAIRGKVQQVDVFDGQPVFNIEVGCLCGIFYIDNKINRQSLVINDKHSNKKIQYENIDDINHFSDIDIYPSLKCKILKICQDRGSLFDNMGTKGKFFVNIAKIRGHGGNSDLHTFMPKEQVIEKNPRMQPFGFKNEEEAKNFISYLENKITRFCLSILKSNKNMHQGELKCVPWINFSEKIDTDILRKLFQINDEEMEFIEKNIPDYY